MKAEREEAIEYIKNYRKLDENLHNIVPEGTISFFATEKCLKYWDIAIKALEQEPCDNWFDVPSDEMTLEQARQAVKDLRKKLAEHLEKEPYDAISRQAAIVALDDRMSSLDNVDMQIAMGFSKGIIYDLQPVTPQPKTGHWININEGKWNTIPVYKCSVCGENANLQDWSGESPFCPWCGAKMQESEGEE